MDFLVNAIAVNTVKPDDDLPSACARSNFKALALALNGVKSKISLDKSEYETEKEFAGRRAKVESILNQQGDIVVCQPLNDNDDVPFTYNADRQSFLGSFNGHQNVWRDVKQTGSYVSKTRMGVHATVKASVDVEYDVSLSFASNKRKSGCLTGDYKFEFEVPISRQQAPLLKDRGFLVFRGKLVYPFVDSSDSPGDPTLDHPRDIYERDITVHFEPATVAVVGTSGSKMWDCSLKNDES